jgi:hypothetical protein
MRKGKTFWRKFHLSVLYFWRPALLGGLLATLLYFLLWFKLGTLTGGLSESEAVMQRHLALQDITPRSILENPLFLPYSITLFVLQELGLHGPTALRGVSAIIGTASAVSFYLLIRRWHTPRLAVFGTLLFATSSWFLHLARYAATDILYVGIIAVLLTGVWLQHSKYRRLMLLFVVTAATLYVYVPGMIWFLAITGVWQYKRLISEMRYVRWWFNLLIIFGGILLLFPLGWSVAHNPLLLKPLLGLPEDIPSISQLLQNAINIHRYIFVKGPDDPAKWLPGTSYLDIFSAMMLVVGIYWSIFKLRLDRIRITYGVLAAGSFLVTLGGPVSMAILLPGIYLLVTAGMTFMLQQWFTVFPRNPIPRTIGTSLLTLAVLVSVFYQINHYFIAWPNAPVVRQTFIYKPLIVD